MDYAKAKAIRGTSFSSLLTDKLVSGKQGIGKSVRSAVSEKMSAKMTGFKEKFDPLNIARAMTGGSALAPALLGRMSGRSQESIKYFAGGKKAAPSVTKIPEDLSRGSGLGAGALEVLSQMFDFMKKSYEINKKRSELQDTFREEKINEEQERHDDFLEVLKQYTSLSAPTATAEKTESGGGILDFIKSMVAGVISRVQSMIEGLVGRVTGLIDKALDAYKWLLELKSLKNLAGVASTLFNVAKFFLTSPIGLGLLAGASLLALLALDKDPEKTTKGMLAAGSEAETFSQTSSVIDETSNIERRRQNLLSERPSSEKSYFNPKEDIDLGKKYLQKIGFDEKTGLTKEDTASGFIGIDDSGKLIPGKTTEGPRISPTEKAGQQLPAEEQRTYNIGVVKSNASTGEMSVPVQRIKKNIPTATSQELTPPSAAVSQLISENQNLKLDEATSATSIAPIVTNKVNNSSSAAKPVSAAASQRDDTDILSYVFGSSRSYF